MGRLGWRKLLKSYLKDFNENDPFASKTDAIKFVMTKNKDNQGELMGFLQLLFSEHRGVTLDNLPILNEHLRSLGLAVNENCQVYLVNRGSSFLTEVDNLLSDLLARISKATIDLTTAKNVLEHHLSKAREHFENRNWDDMSSQLRKGLESLIVIASLLKSNSGIDSINGQLKTLVAQGTLSQNEKDMIYALYGMLSDKGAHPGIGNLDESLLRYRLTIEIARYLIRLL